MLPPRCSATLPSRVRAVHQALDEGLLGDRPLAADLDLRQPMQARLYARALEFLAKAGAHVGEVFVIGFVGHGLTLRRHGTGWLIGKVRTQRDSALVGHTFSLV
jgi:hypothetical protein